MPPPGLTETTKEVLSLSQILSNQGLTAQRAEKKVQPPPDTPPKIQILVVEDERIVARDLHVRLTNLGYEISGTASSRAEAIASVQQSRPDLVLMDIRLNGVPEGIEAARDLRMNFNLPVIYLTGHSDSNTLARARLTEPFGYILKPFENRELVAAIETAVYKHKAETQRPRGQCTVAIGAAGGTRGRLRLERRNR